MQPKADRAKWIEAHSAEIVGVLSALGYLVERIEPLDSNSGIGLLIRHNDLTRLVMAEWISDAR